MNILQFTTNSGPSGRNQHLLLLARGLQQRGHQVTTLCPPDGWLPLALRDAGLPAIEKKIRGLRSLRQVRELVRYIHARKINLIHAHTTRAAFYGFLIGRLTGIAVVATVHVMSDVAVYRWLLPGCTDTIIAVSNFVRAAMLQQGIAASRVRTVYNGTDFFEADASEIPVTRAELDVPADAQLIGVFALVSRQKGQELLVRAARDIVRQCPRAHFIFVGTLPPPEQQRLLEIAATDNVLQHMHFTGYRPDVRRFMKAMDVVVMPSQMETFGMVIIEAMILGKPIVATRIGGIPEAVVDGETGLLINQKPHELAEAVVSLLQNPERRIVMGQAGRGRARTYFSAATMLENIEALYRDVLKSKQ